MPGPDRSNHHLCPACLTRPPAGGPPGSPGRAVLMTANWLAVLLGVTPARCYELARLGILPSVRLGRSVRFATADIEHFLALGGSLGPLADASTAVIDAASVDLTTRRRARGVK